MTKAGTMKRLQKGREGTPSSAVQMAVSLGRFVGTGQVFILGQKYSENASTSARLRTASHPKHTIVLLHDVFNQRQPYAGTRRSLSGKKGMIQYSGQVRRSDPATPIRDGQA
jgi:hypothetical protein